MYVEGIITSVLQELAAPAANPVSVALLPLVVQVKQSSDVVGEAEAGAAPPRVEVSAKAASAREANALRSAARLDADEEADLTMWNSLMNQPDALTSLHYSNTASNTRMGTMFYPNLADG